MVRPKSIVVKFRDNNDMAAIRFEWLRFSIDGSYNRVSLLQLRISLIQLQPIQTLVLHTTISDPRENDLLS